MNLALLMKIESEDDRDEVEQFAEFLQTVGSRKDPEYPRRLRDWIAADPTERLAYLGFSEEDGRKLGVLE